MVPGLLDHLQVLPLLHLHPLAHLVVLPHQCAHLLGLTGHLLILSSQLPF